MPEKDQPDVGSSLRKIHQFSWPLFDEVVAETMQKQPEVVCLQIGANDGQLVDPVFPHIKNGLTAHLVEPHPDYFAKLQRLHSERPWVTMDRVAVGAQALPTRTLYFLTETEELPTNCADGVASFYRQHVLEFCQIEQISDVDRHLRSVEVPVVTYSDLLGRKAPDFRPDILVIDVEGEDASILDQMFACTGELPAVVLYEHSHMSDEAESRLRQVFTDRDYTLAQIKDETLAYLA